MKLLLDTNALLWWLEDSPRLGEAARDAIGDPANAIFVSLVSLWEVAIKIRIGKLKADFAAIDAQLDLDGFVRLPLAVRHLHGVMPLSMHHRDPFDHLLIAQAQVEGLMFVSADRIAAEHGIDLLACD